MTEQDIKAHAVELAHYFLIQPEPRDIEKVEMVLREVRDATRKETEVTHD